MAALAKKIKFTYILIPEDEDKDLQELVCEYTSETIVPCLTNACKKHYQKAKKVNESKYRDQLLAQIKSKDPNAVIPEETLKMLSQVQLVSIDPLLFNEANNDYYGVSLYTDDSASAKNSKVNSRATSIAHACGKNITVIGDAFLSASRDDQRDYFVRCDLKIEDITGANDNHWMERARLQAQNMQQQRQTQGQTTKKKAVSKAQAKAYKVKLIKWKESKLRDFDTNEEFRVKKIEKYGSRNGYEQFLQDKLTKKCQDSLGYVP